MGILLAFLLFIVIKLKISFELVNVDLVSGRMTVRKRMRGIKGK